MLYDGEDLYSPSEDIEKIMESVSAASNDKNGGLPADAVKIGTVRLGEEPRTSSFLSKTTLVAGYALSWLSSVFSQELVSDLAKENVAAHELVKGDGFFKAFQKGINRSVDLKLWKSNVAQFGVLFGGIALTNYAVRKVEESTFKKQHGELPRRDQIDQILQGKFESAPSVEQKQSANWQDKVKKAEEPQQGIGA